jgi:hypothetical protein
LTSRCARASRRKDVVAEQVNFLAKAKAKAETEPLLV